MSKEKQVNLEEIKEKLANLVRLEENLKIALYKTRGQIDFCKELLGEDIGNGKA